jgi:hypothetical protein
MFFNTMPSGYVTRWGDYLRPEYWYLFAYFALAYLTVIDREKILDVLLILASFLVIFPYGRE